MTIRQFLAIVELRTKVVSASTCLYAILYALWRDWRVDPWLAALAYLCALAVDMGTTAFNSYFDWYRNVDDPRFNRESDKILVHEGVSPGHAALVAAACFLVATALGCLLAFLATPLLLPIGAACLLVGFAYSGGPRPISATPFGELFAGGFLGTALFAVMILAVSRRFDAQVALASLPQALFVGAVLAVNNACDMEGDTAAGRRTLAILLGPRAAPWIVYAQLFAAEALMAGLSLAGVLPAPSAIAGTSLAIPTLALAGRMSRRGYSHATKGANMRTVAALFTLAGLAQAAALAAAKILG